MQKPSCALSTRLLAPFMLVVSVTLLPQCLMGQGKQVSTSSQQWIQYYNQAAISSHWTWLLDGGFRWKDDLSTPSQFLIRTGVSYQLNDRITVGGGIATFGSYTGHTINRREYRSFEELGIKDAFGKVLVQHRIRIEERYFRNFPDGAYIGDNSNWRFRYRLQGTIPVANFKPQRLLLTVGDEIFINAGKQITNVYDQNRLLVGPVIEFSKAISFSVLYNGQFASQAKPGNYARTRVLWLGITTKLNFKKQSGS